ncbi:NlpC/P60 family protein [Streptomyces sp. W16]|uniref:C40 family peptidase n=1 Tax=Streptomyces sp. W16 TaxID=3076631 RepID=UPI00295BE719|nr:NlpC/P60 family protein [Streptomyces sp. W16]MDV9175269.1 NlpC/P60 family protein [Streptomyces sp. W16]
MPAERRTRTGGSGPTVDDRPSRDEVQRRINSLYDRAETATGNYNATRKMSGGPRQRVEPRPSASRPSDPALDAVTKQWFDRARAQLGPTVPAILPPGRTPARPAARPERTERRPEAESGGRALEAQPGRAVAELTAGAGVPESATPQLAAPVAELTAGPIAALPPAAPQAPQMPQIATPQSPQMQQMVQMPQATVLDLQPVPAIEVPPAPALEPQQFAVAAAPAPVFDPLTADLELLPYIAAPRTESAPAGATWPPPETSWPTPETTWSTGSMPMVPEQQMWSTGQMPVVPEQQAWATGQMPIVTEQQTWATGQMPVIPEQQAWATGQMPMVTEQRTSYSTPDPGWRPPQQEWQPTPPAAEVSFAATPAAAPEFTLPTAPTMAPEIILPAAPTFSPAPVAAVPDALQDPSTLSKTSTALAFARAQIGRPCLWGAAGPDAYDCSSLTQAAWKAAGVLLPRTAQEQSGAGALVPLTDIRPGDLIFFYDSIDHVGLYTGNGLMIHAPSPGTPIREESIFYAGSAAIRGAVRPA